MKGNSIRGTHVESDGRREDGLATTMAADDDPTDVADECRAAQGGHDETKDLDAAVWVARLVVDILGDRDGEDEEVEGDHDAPSPAKVAELRGDSLLLLVLVDNNRKGPGGAIVLGLDGVSTRAGEQQLL